MSSPRWMCLLWIGWVSTRARRVPAGIVIVILWMLAWELGREAGSSPACPWSWARQGSVASANVAMTTFQALCLLGWKKSKRRETVRRGKRRYGIWHLLSKAPMARASIFKRAQSVEPAFHQLDLVSRTKDTLWQVKVCKSPSDG